MKLNDKQETLNEMLDMMKFFCILKGASLTKKEMEVLRDDKDDVMIIDTVYVHPLDMYNKLYKSVFNKDISSFINKIKEEATLPQLAVQHRIAKYHFLEKYNKQQRTL